ncbi:MAG: DUF423 domain-containing protein [Pirellulaceae bacterium]|jgi:uncharacterized membrane protein YgdD (TMEM256/DUF423 family)
MRWIVLIAGLLGAVGVAIGAHAAHGLEAMLLQQGVVEEQVAQRLSQCDVASRYHMLHCLALLTLGLLADGLGTKRRVCAASFFLLGIMLFSGGLYSMVYLGQMGHWAIVPSGGLCFILGWLFTASLAWKRSAVT